MTAPVNPVLPQGILLIDKPSGVSSGAVVSKIKWLLKKEVKVGHAGTLDPLASGLLVILLGRATRLQSIFLESKKAYDGEILLGVKTSTDDLEGEVIASDDELIFLANNTESEIALDIEREFTRTYQQTPPEFSAIKVNGKRAYDLARKGQLEKPLEARKVSILSLSIKFKEKNILAFETLCTKGTYIRSLARDIGAHLGSFACIRSLRRTHSTPFSLSDALPFEGLTSERILSSIIAIEESIKHLPVWSCSEEQGKQLKNGVQTPLDTISDLNFESEVIVIKSELLGLVGFAKRTSSGQYELSFVI